MNPIDRQQPHEWGAFLNEGVEAAAGRTENEWISYVAEMERRSIEAGRSAEKQIRLHRDRERERLRALRDLEERITQATEKLRAAEGEAVTRAAAIDAAIRERERYVAELDVAIESRQSRLREADGAVAEHGRGVTAAQQRLDDLAAQEQRAKERLILLRTRGDAQLREYEEKLAAVNRRANTIVTEAADKVHRLQDIERELTSKVNAIEAQLQVLTDAVRLSSSASSPLLPPPYKSRGSVAAADFDGPPQVLDRQYITVNTPTPSRSRHGTSPQTRGESGAPVASMELGDLTEFLARLEGEFRDSLVEVAAHDAARANKKRASGSASASSGSLMEF